MKWTADQQKVIDARHQNVLVSAAAGSGKTAVLVERILELVLDVEHPIDIYRLLIVTFTNAAAEEMRTRLYEALLQRAAKEPENRHLRRQLQLVFRAQVSTIDSFCLYILRNYPEKADIDPAFRLMDRGESKLLESDVMTRLLEEEYGESRESFLEFLEGFSGGKTDEGVSSLVLSLYHFSRSHPWPEKWLASCVEKCGIESAEALYGSDWCSWYLTQARLQLQGIIDRYRKICRMCESPLVPESFLHAYQMDIGKLEGAGEFGSYREAREKIQGIEWQKQPSKSKKSGYDEALQVKIQGKRKALKERFQKLQDYFSETEEGILAEIRASQGSIRELCRLTGRFAELYSEEKKKRGIADFSDLEHTALSILYENGEPTDAARELSERFEEIMIDEYQDSNRVQEALLTAVSRIPSGRYNMFMVGDMKQSIYRFRMADPSLFTEKYAVYTREESERRLIELSQNFRSRREVTRSVNWFFFQLMQRTVGGIEYDLHSALYCGAEYPPEEKGSTRYRTEILLADTEDAPEELPGIEAEALMIADKIRALVSEAFPVTERSKGGETVLRPVEYRDIVILLRTASGQDQVIQQVLEEQGIPVYAESRGGYFDAQEVRLALNLLSVIDNPMNDIPLAAVLHSALFGFTADELARIRALSPVSSVGNGFYGALLAYSPEDALQEKIRDFLSQLKSWRQAGVSLSLSMLLRRLYRETGLLSYVSALPGGDRRKANLMALLSKAADFEKTSYHGIFHFIRYVEKLRKYQADEGEQNTVSDRDNVVRIMTIHKSKGLEFPVVFLAGCGKTMNASDERQRIILHQDFGIAADLADPKKRLRKKTFMRSVFGERNRVERLGEEMRVLYVGMTRAKEKLFLTAAVKDREKILQCAEDWEELPGKLSYGEISGASSYLDWILAAAGKNGPVSMELVPAEQLVRSREEQELQSLMDYASLKKEILSDREGEELLTKALKERFSFRYDDSLSRVYATISVSALKAAAYREEERESAALVDDREGSGLPVSGQAADSQKGPAPFVALGQGIRGAARGTLYHSMMEKIDPHRPAKEQLDALLSSGEISAEERQAVFPPKIDAFFSSELGKRFIRAYDRKEGFRERQFIIGIPAPMVYPELKDTKESAEMLMLQGVVDLYFEEDGELVVVDYKTDAVSEEETLLQRYRIQLELYARALEQATGKRVKEKWIWSFALGKEIPV